MTTDADIAAYKKKAEAEMLADVDADFQAFVDENTRTLTRAPVLEDGREVQMQKRRVVQSSVIEISKTGVPRGVFSEKQRTEGSGDGNDGNDEDGGTYVRVVMPHERPRGETEEERQKRKQLVKDAKRIRREQKKELKEQFGKARLETKRQQDRQRRNVQGKEVY